MVSFLGGGEIAGTTAIGINKFHVSCSLKRFSRIGTRQKKSISRQLQYCS